MLTKWSYFSGVLEGVASTLPLSFQLKAQSLHQTDASPTWQLLTPSYTHGCITQIDSLGANPQMDLTEYIKNMPSDKKCLSFPYYNCSCNEIFCSYTCPETPICSTVCSQVTKVSMTNIGMMTIMRFLTLSLLLLERSARCGSYRCKSSECGRPHFDPLLCLRRFPSPLFSMWDRNLEYHVQFWDPQYKKGMEVLEWVYLRTTKMVKGWSKERMRRGCENCVCSALNRQRGGFIVVYSYLIDIEKMRTISVYHDKRRHKLEYGKFWLDIRKTIFTLRVVRHCNRGSEGL